VYVNRNLVKEDWGLFSFFLGSVAILLYPMNSLQLWINTKINVLVREKGISLDYVFIHYLKYIAIFYVPIIILLLIFKNQFAYIFKIPSDVINMIYILFLISMVCYATFVGVLQGTHQYFKISIFRFLATIFKMMLVAYLIYTSFSVYRALGSNFIPNFLIIAIMFIQYLHYSRRLKKTSTYIEINKKYFNFKKDFFDIYRVSIGVGVLVFLTNFDIVVVRSLFAAEASGELATAALIGKVIIFVTTPIVNIFYPTAVSKGKDSFKLLLSTFKITALINIALFAGLFVFVTFFQNIVFTNRYDSIKGLSFLYSFNSFILVNLIFSLYYLIGLKKRNIYRYLGLVIIAGISAIYFAPRNLWYLLLIETGMFTLLLGIILRYLIYTNKKDKIPG
jgi:O-antigen/teichoic acid export membrane protein